MPDDAESPAPRRRSRSPQAADATRPPNSAESPLQDGLEIPRIELPNGGGALKSIDEKFQVNAANGTASLSVPLPFSKCRSDFAPALTLDYDSGSGNGPCGLGWTLRQAFIQRRTDKLLPRYRDSEESDVFVLSGVEDLVPALLQDGSGSWTPDEHTAPTGEFVKRYRPRLETQFARIERITLPGGATFWKVTTRDHVVTFFGRSAASQVADPDDATRVFQWLPELSYDDKGNCLEYGYLPEDFRNVPHVASEANRLGGFASCANTYLKWVKYGNKIAYTPGADSTYNPPVPGDARYFFQMVVDYGDHDLSVPTPDPQRDWPCRLDPFSRYKAGFEVRTYRLCQRLLFFHFFKELNDGVNPAPYLVRSLDISYRYFGNPAATPAELRDMEVDYPLRLVRTHYRKSGAGYDQASFPPLTLTYQERSWNQTVEEVSLEELAGAPAGLSPGYQWVDLWSEGISGILSEQGQGWFYKRNLGDGTFTVARPIAPKPSFVGLTAGSLSIQDLEADGRKAVVMHAPPLQGFFPLSEQDEPQPFRAFERAAHVLFTDPNTKFVDLNGDGRPDLLVSEDAVFRWYPSLGTRGYGDPELAGKSHDEERGPALVFSDATESIYLVDMTGDGLTDVARIRNGEVCYWPNLGYGRFGAKVTMDAAPLFDNQDLFNPSFIHLADISGTGATDILYLGQDRFRAWLNQSGNAWSLVQELSPFPTTESGNQLSVVDLLGKGTSCIVWSSPWPSYTTSPMRYVDLMGGRKPYLLAAYTNGLGKTVAWEYKSSTHYYLQDERAGKPWLTKLPFPVQCVAKISFADAVTRAYLSREYSYHHGYYDHAEREYRGFGRVDQTDSETFDVFVLSGTSNIVDQPLHQTPALTRTWFHTGVFLGESDLLSRYRDEYFQSAHFSEDLQPDPPPPPHLTAIERREAARAFKGRVLRQEIYGLDDGAGISGVPFSVIERRSLVQLTQPRAANPYAVFLTTESEAITYAYERNDADPRVLHTLNTRVDELGNILESATVSYPRQAPSPGLPPHVVATQARMWIRYSVTAYTADVVSASVYRLRQPCETQSFEILGTAPAAGYFALGEIAVAFASASAIPYEATPNGTLQKRLLRKSRVIFLKNDLSTPLPLGQMDTLGLRYQSYRLALTDTLAASLYGTTVTPALLAEGKYASSQACKAAGFFPATDPDNQWWIPSGRSLYPASAATKFYLPNQFVDAWGNTTTVTYYADYQLLLAQVVDALNNETSALAFEWRVLAPQQTKDFNDNLTEVRYDIRCLVVGTALEGKGAEADDFTGFVAETTPVQLAQFFADPATHGPGLLQNASSRFVYDFSVAPARVATILRETHSQAARAAGTPSKLQYLFEYTGGFGQMVMRKAQCRPGLAKTLDIANNVVEVDTTPKLRWIGTGRTVFNNRGNPVMQYEPYFSVTPAYEDEPQLVEIGVTSITHYDALGRVFRVDLPNGTFTTEVIEGWSQTSYDPNDNVKSSQWYIDRTTGSLSGNPQENQAAQKAAVHDDTPLVKHLDGQGRAFFRIDHNRFVDNFTHMLTDELYDTETLLDVEGNALGVLDPRGNTAVQTGYDMLGNGAHTAAMDSGERWTLNDAFGKRLYSWDSKQRTFHCAYDALHRSIAETVLEQGALQPILFEKSVYGEGQPGDKAANLRGRLFQRFEPCGFRAHDSYDFKGNALSRSFTFTVDYQNDIDWSLSPQPALQLEVFTTLTAYDALNRPTRVQGPSVSTATAEVIVPTYDETRKLEALDVYIRGAVAATHFVANIDYNEKGQRERVDFGNGVSTVFKYDPFTFRLVGVVTSRNTDPEVFWDDPNQISAAGNANDVLQFLRYTFDPIGNPTFITDLAQDVIYFNSAKVDPSADYTYDAVYRLIQALGREHIGQGRAPDAYDAVRVGNPQPGDGTQMRRYTQQYAYDAAGNLKVMSNAGGWSRAFTYSANDNRLLTALAGADPPFTYTYDAHGCILAMPQLSSASWDFADRLRHVVIAPSPNAPQDGWYGYDASGGRMRKVVRKGALTEERLYVGPFERFRRYNGATVLFERETFHVMDGSRRIAMVDTPTVTRAGSDEQQLIRYQHGNHLGSSCVEVDEAARIISYEEYYPFGSTSYQGTDQTREVPAKRYRYAGKARDEESGLEYHGARYCAPWLARWTQPDPAGLVDGTNRYCYARDNPVRLVDPDGRQAQAGDQDKTKRPQQQQAQSQPAPGDKKPDDLPDPPKEPEKFKGPQPTIYFPGPTQTAFLPGDVKLYNARLFFEKRPGSVASEFNFFVLPQFQKGGSTTSYLQYSARFRTGGEVEQGFMLQLGGQTGSSTTLFYAGYLFHQGTQLDPDEKAPFQKGSGNWFNLGYQSTPQENPSTPASNLVGNYLHAWSFAWAGGNTEFDVNVGVNFGVRGTMMGNRDVWGYANPFAGINVSRQLKLPLLGTAAVNLEGVTGPNFGAALVNPAAGDPSVPFDVKSVVGLGVQKRVGEDYTLGVEVLGNVEYGQNVPGPTPWGIGLAATLAVY